MENNDFGFSICYGDNVEIRPPERFSILIRQGSDYIYGVTTSTWDELVKQVSENSPFKIVNPD